MKKQLLSFISALSVTAAVAQTPSPSLNINQDAVFPNPTSVTFPGIKFLDAVDQNVVWTIGQDLQFPSRNYNWYSRSINGGNTFSGGNIYADTNTYHIANMEGIDANTAWVSAYLKNSGNPGLGAIHRTTNGGATWVNMTQPGMYSNAASFLNIVSFFTPSVGVTLGDPINGEYEIWRTTNGGLSWSMIPGASIPNPLSSSEFGIVNLYYKLGTSNLWWGTNEGRMYRTTDAGLTWSVSTVGSPTSVLIEIAFSSPLEGMCTLIDNNAWELWHTFDGGATWTQIPTIDPNFGFADIGGIPGTGLLVSVGVGGGNEIISSSSDNGVTWTDWGSSLIPYTSVDFVDNTTGWAGSLDFQTFSNMWKYSGAALQGTVSPTSAFSLPPDICLTGSTGTVQAINSSTGSPMPTYAWSAAPGGVVFSSPTATSPLITFPGAGTYTVTLVATSSAGSNSSSQVITVNACVAPVATFSMASSACTNYTFDAVNTSAGAPTPGYFWSITPAGGTTISPGPSASNPQFRVANAGTYSITLLASNASGTASTTQTISVTACPPNINFSIPAQIAFCADMTSTTFSTTNSTSNPQGASGTITYTWSVAPNSGISVAPNFFTSNLLVTATNTSNATYTVTLRARNASGTSSLTQVVSVVTDCLIAGINDNTLQESFGIYPNPVRDHVSLSLPAGRGEYSVRITNLVGQVVYSEKSSKSENRINVSGLNKGVYFVTVESKGEQATKKIIIE